MANYYLARLKIRALEYDSSLGFLKYAVLADSQRVRTLCERDREIWLPVSDDERFKELFRSTSAAKPGQ